MKFPTAITAKERQRVSASRTYPVSRVVLDPTCTLEMILNRAAYGMKIPQRDVSGDITPEEMSVLGLHGTSFATMSRMEIIDLRMRAQMRMNALQAKQAKVAQKKAQEEYKKGIIAEYEQSKVTE